MTQTNDSCRGGRPSGARSRGAGRIATRRTRVRVSSDAVVSAYIQDIARPHADGHASSKRFARRSSLVSMKKGRLSSSGL